MLLCLVAGTAAAGCSWFDDRRAPARGEAFTASGQLANDAVTPAHATLGAAANDFFSVKSTPQQPIDLTYQEELANTLFKVKPEIDIFRGVGVGYAENIAWCLHVPLKITSHGPRASDKRRVRE